METGLFQRCGTVLMLMAGIMAAQDTVIQATYKGQWEGTGGGGDIHVTFRDGGDGKLSPEVGFTLGGQDVTCKVLSFKIEGAKFNMVYQFDGEGNLFQSAVEATVRGKTMEGTYKTTAGDQSVDRGTWKATAP